MTLVIGAAPFGHPPAGEANFDLELPDTVLFMEASPKRVRVYYGGEKIADSRSVKLLHETGRTPVYYFPVEDVRMGLLEESGRREEHEARGPVAYHTVTVDGDAAADAAWTHPDPPDSAAFLRDLVAFEWDAMDAWFEEEEEVEVHPRGPHHRIDVLRTSRRVRVRLDDVLLADTRRAMVLYETGLPPRYYIPASDVAMERLEPSDTHTRCPYKGVASYYSVRTEEGLHDDLVWYYPDPLPEAERVGGLMAFYNEKVDLELDGDLQERPRTKFS